MIYLIKRMKKMRFEQRNTCPVLGHMEAVSNKRKVWYTQSLRFRFQEIKIRPLKCGCHQIFQIMKFLSLFGLLSQLCTLIGRQDIYHQSLALNQ